MFTRTKKSLIIYWVTLVIIAEIIMLFLNRYLSVIYLIIAGMFLIGFLLRILRLYPGKYEPLILDFSAILISFLFAYIAEVFRLSNGRFVVILFSSLIILPHLAYIISNKNI